MPGNAGCFTGKIESHHLESAFAKHSREETAAASHVQHGPGFLTFEQSPANEMDVIPQHEPPVEILQAVRRCLLRRIPVAVGIVGLQLIRAWPGGQANQRATEALHYQKAFVRRVIQAIVGAKQTSGLSASAGRAGFAVWGLDQIACSINSLSEMRYRNRSRRIWRLLNLRKCRLRRRF